MKKLLPLLLFGLFLAACQQSATDRWEPLDLMSYGIPVSVQAPDSARVQVSNLGGGLIKDVTIKAGADYYIQLYASGAETTDIAKLKADQLSEVKANRYFTRIVEEEEDGFIYETQIDSVVSFGFRHIRVQGDTECIFQTGLVGQFSLEDVENMYAAVKVR